MSEPLHIVFAVFPNVTQLDFTGPYQVFARLPGAKLTIASSAGGEISGDGMTFANVAKLSDVGACDVFLVPGGYGTTDAALDPVFIHELQRLAADARFVTSVCTGSLALGAAGLLKGKRAACHWAWRDLLTQFGAVPDPARVVRDGNVMTGGGVTAGIDLALTVVAELAGEREAQMIQLVLEYAPAPPFDSGRPETAPTEILAATQARLEPLIAKRRADAAEAARRLRR